MFLRLQYRAAQRSLLLCLIIAFIVSSSSMARTTRLHDLEFQQARSNSKLPGILGLERAYLGVRYASVLDAWTAGRRQPVPDVRTEAARYVAMTARHSGDASSKPAARSEKIVALAREAVEVNSKSASALETLGALESSSDDPSPEALQHLEGAARLEPTAMRWLAVSHACQDQLCRFSALQEAQRLTRTGDSDGFEARAVTLAFSRYYVGREQREKARDLLVPLVAAAPAEIVARKLLADVNLSIGLGERAREQYEALERDFPQPVWIKRELAAAYENLGLLDRATKLADAAFAENRDGIVEQNLVRRLAEKRRNSSALRTFYLALSKYEPGNPNVASHLAELSADQGDLQAAQRTVSDALTRDPQNAALHQQFADLLASSGQHRRAEAEFEIASTLSPSSDALLYRRQWRSNAGSADSDAPYLANFDSLEAARAHQGTTGTLANVTALADVRIDRLQVNGLYSSRVQQFFRVETTQGARELGSRSVNYAPASESLQHPACPCAQERWPLA